MAKAIIYKGYLSDTEAEHFERLNPGWTVKNCDVLCFTDDSGTSTEYVILLARGQRQKCAGIVGNAM